MLANPTSLLVAPIPLQLLAPPQLVASLPSERCHWVPRVLLHHELQLVWQLDVEARIEAAEWQSMSVPYP